MPLSVLMKITSGELEHRGLFFLNKVLSFDCYIVEKGH
jgi:hypothetical protein